MASIDMALEDLPGNAVRSTSGGRNAEETIPLIGHDEDEVPLLITWSMMFAGLRRFCGFSCVSSNNTYNGQDFLSQAEFWSPIETEGPNTAGAEQRREAHGQHQEDHQGCAKWNYVYQVLWIILLPASILFFICDIILFLMYTKLENKYLLDTASFICLNFQTFLLIIYTTITRLLCSRRGNPTFYAVPYEMDTCRRRVTLVQAFYNTSGKCYLKSLAVEIVTFFLLPLLNTILQIAFGFGFPALFPCFEHRYHMFTVVFKSVLYLYYGCFWYVVYVQRVHLHCTLNNALDTIRQLAGQTDCEGARRLIDRIYSEFHVVRYFTGWLMAFTLLTVTFHALCCVILLYCKLSMAIQTVKRRDIFFLIMLLIQNIMFFGVPIRAIGGINLEPLWKKFRHVLIKCKVEGQIAFWNEVWSYVAQIDTLASFPLVWTWLFPSLGTSILAWIFVRRDNISLEHWSYLSNCTSSMESNFTCPV